MTSVAFDTHRAVKALREAGVEERQAEAITQIVQQSADLPDVTTLATKADLSATKSDLEAAIAKLESKLVWLVVALGAVGAFANGGFVFLTKVVRMG
jgi:aspartate/glutamate racemase